MVLLYVHLKIDVFPISFPFPLYQGNTLSLSNCFTLLVNFLTVCKSLLHLCILTGSSDSKNPDLYYFINITIYKLIFTALRAMALSKWGMILSKAGQGDPAGIWKIVQVRLDCFL